MVRRLAAITLITSFLVLPLAMAPVRADGMTHVYDASHDEWTLSQEDRQYGMINHVMGKERLLMSIRIDEDSLNDTDRAVWIFPIPADPEDTYIEIMPAVTEFRGTTVADLACGEFCSNLILGYGTQLYPLIAVPLMVGLPDSHVLLPRSGYSDAIDVLQHVESQGLTSEVVSTEDPQAFESYLQDCGLTLDEAASQLVDEYLGQGYSFVVSWIPDVSVFISEGVLQYDEVAQEGYYELGLFVKFPVDRMYFPLRLTSIYGDTEVPVHLQIVGYAEPDESENDYGSLQIAVTHKMQEYYTTTGDLYPFFTSDDSVEYDNSWTIHDMEYTEMTISVPSEELDADLWIVPASSAKLDMQVWVLDHGFISALIVIIGISMVAGVTAGWFVYAPYRPVLWKFALLGLANLLTIVGLWAAVKYLKVERTFTRSTVAAPENPNKLDFIMLYTFVFVIALGVILMAFWR